MIAQEVQPLVVAATSTGDGVIEFRTRTERIIVDSQVALINEILRFCDGRNTVATIVNKVAQVFDAEHELVCAVIEDLVPINFGYGRDHISHSLVKDGVDQTSVPFPHYLA